MSPKIKTPPPVLVSYAITRRCDLKCPHCYSESIEQPHPDELNTEEAKQLISEIADLGTRMLIFDGGEPTLREDLPELVKHAYDGGLTPLLGSHGMTLTESFARKLKDAGLKCVAISLDGAKPQTHDRFRGLEGAWEKTIERMKNCGKVGLRFQIDALVHKYNYTELPEVVEIGKRYGANAIEVFDYVPSGRGLQHRGYDLDNETRRRIIDEIIKMQLREELTFRVIGVPEYWVEVEKKTMEKEILEEEQILKFVRTCCGAGVRYITIFYHGIVCPCMLLQIPLGNVRDKSFKEIWTESSVLNELRDRSLLKGKCGICKYKNVCTGARCRSYLETGDHLAEDPICWFKREEIEEIG